MDEHKVLWDGKTSSSEPPLRRPRRPPTNSTSNNSNTEILQNSNQSLDLSASFNSSISIDDDILSRSTLSADAKEWFPPNYNDSVTSEPSTPPVKKSVQGRLQKFKVVPDTQMNEESEKEINEEDGYSPVDAQNGIDEGVHFDEAAANDFAKLQKIILTFTEDPGRFHDLLGSFIETLGPYYDDINVITNAVQLIVNQALSEPNFQYVATRLCSIIEEQCPIFRTELFMFCKLKLEENSYDSNLALFLAEIYARLNYDQLYGPFVVKALQSVLSLGDSLSVKSVCQALKLMGASLELHNKEAVDDIFRQLQITKEMQLVHIKNLIDSVTALRAANWGQSPSSPVTQPSRHPSQGSQEQQVLHDEPILYGPDGKELTEEERQFLADNCIYQVDSATDDSDSVIEPDPEMDEEMQVAFLEFLRLQK